MKIRYLAIFLSLIAVVAFVLPEMASARKGDDTIYLTATNMPININCHEATELYKEARMQVRKTILGLVSVEKVGMLLKLQDDQITFPTHFGYAFDKVMLDIAENITKLKQITGALTLSEIPMRIDYSERELTSRYIKFGRAVQAVCDKCDATPEVMKDDGLFCHVFGTQPNPITE